MSSRGVVLFLFSVCSGSVLLNCDATGTSFNSAPLAGQAYFAIRPDTRACAAPTCGGFWVSELNQSETRCADGNTATQTTGCYVAEINSDTQGLAERTRQLSAAIVKGKILAKTFGSSGNLGELRLSEAWQPVIP
jgi:hypothetical protein